MVKNKRKRVFFGFDKRAFFSFHIIDFAWVPFLSFCKGIAPRGVYISSVASRTERIQSQAEA